MNRNDAFNIAERLQLAHSQIADFAMAADRNPQDISLIAVSKTKPVEMIVNAYQAGQKAFGENYVQEGVEKIKALASYPDIEWHYIGPLQSNKTRLVAENFSWCQTIDRLKIAQRLSDQRPKELAPINICIQVNIDSEASKAGVSPLEVFPLAKQLISLPGIRLKGIMAIPNANANPNQQQQSFRQLNELFQQLCLKFADADTLSLGMSGDLKNAIMAGSTMVRIGTAIFGARAQKPVT